MPRYTATASFALSAPPAPGIPSAFTAGQAYDLPAEFAKSFPGFLARADGRTSVPGSPGERAVDVTDGPAAVASADAEAAAPVTRKATAKEKAPTKRAEAEPGKAPAKKAAAKKAPAKTKGARK